MTTKTKFYQRIQWNYSHTDTTHYKTTITNKPHNNDITQYPLTNIQRILTSQEAHVPSGN